MTDRESRERLVELIEQAEGLKNNDFPSIGELADHLIANGVFILPEDLRDTEDFSISAFIEAMQMYKEKDRYIKLPCKVGRTVYEFGCNDPFGDPLDLYVVESTVSGIAVFTSEDIHNMNCFGKTVFLTREEAEKALKEREGK